MDIWGVEGIEAEAELLSAITTFFKRVGITSADVGLKVGKYIKYICVCVYTYMHIHTLTCMKLCTHVYIYINIYIYIYKM